MPSFKVWCAYTFHDFQNQPDNYKERRWLINRWFYNLMLIISKIILRSHKFVKRYMKASSFWRWNLSHICLHKTLQNKLMALWTCQLLQLAQNLKMFLPWPVFSVVTALAHTLKGQGSIPSYGTHLDCRFDFQPQLRWVGECGKQQIDMSLSYWCLSFSL